MGGSSAKKSVPKELLFWLSIEYLRQIRTQLAYEFPQEQWLWRKIGQLIIGLAILGAILIIQAGLKKFLLPQHPWACSAGVDSDAAAANVAGCDGADLSRVWIRGPPDAPLSD